MNVQIRNTTADQVRAALTSKVEVRTRIGWRDTPEGIKRTVMAASCRQLKKALRGRVYQDQKRFCRQMEDLGFDMAWCDSLLVWVVTDKIPDERLERIRSKIDENAVYSRSVSRCNKR